MPLELYHRGRIFWARGYPADGDEYVRKSLGTSDEALAQAAVREIESSARKRRILGPDAPKAEDELTFAACVMLTDLPASDRRYLKPIVRKIGRIRVKEITPAFVRKLAKDLYPFAAVDTWQRQVITPIRSTINHAHELGKCPPIRIRRFDEDDRIRQDRARGKESRIPRRPGSWEWLEAFKAAAAPRDAALAHFMFRHGARVSQSILMEKKADLDLTAGRVRLPATKGHPAEWIKLDPEEVVMIANLPPAYRGSSQDRIFGIGGKRAPRALYRRWEATCAAAGIEYLRPHEAGRHGFGTEMIVRRGVNVVDAARQGRWASPAVMLETYSHEEGSEAKVRDAFAAGRTPPVQAKSSKGTK